jgi:hypothetical protein
MLSTPLELGADEGAAACRVTALRTAVAAFGADLATGTEAMSLRVIERLAETIARAGATGTTTGGGLTTPVKPMFPNVGGNSGAWAADGGATATDRPTGAVVAIVEAVEAEAGKAKEATSAPEMTITAEALLAGLAEREMVDERDNVEVKKPGTR